MLDDVVLNFLRHLAKGLADQFGPNCEVVIHDLSDNYKENSIVAIENGHVTNRKVGDGPSMAVLDALRSEPDKLQDHTSYLTKTKDGRILKSTTIYIRNENQKVIGIFSINYDITELMMVENAIKPLISVASKEEQVSPIPQNVTDLLNELIEESTRQVGKPVPLMTREDKIKAIKFLNDRGALLITKAGDKNIPNTSASPNTPCTATSTAVKSEISGSWLVARDSLLVASGSWLVASIVGPPKGRPFSYAQM